ncbi:hypothetical protein YC2023_009010 [Brassica napus]
MTLVHHPRLSSSYVLGMLPVLEQQMDGAMSHAPSSHPARVRPAMMKMRLELQGTGLRY